jgi:chorismate mutase
MNLNELRDELSSIDRRLLEVVAERQRIVGEIGRNKLVTGHATRDYEREKVVLETARDYAQSLSLDPKLAEGILRSLIHASLASQERDRVAAEG